MRILTLALLLVASPAFAVTDPQGILPGTDEILEGLPFARAFVPGDEIEFTFRECSFLGCPTPGKTVARVIEEDGQIKIAQYKPTGEVFSLEPLADGDWEGARRNYLRARIASTESFGIALTVNAIAETTCPAVAGEAGKGACWTVKVSGSNAAGLSTEIDYVIRRARSGLGQVLAYTQKDTGWIKRTLEYRLVSVKALTR